MSAQYPVNDRVGQVVELLNVLDKWIDEIPPTEQPQRFGNKSFRAWYNKLKEVSLDISFIFLVFNEILLLSLLRNHQPC